MPSIIRLEGLTIEHNRDGSSINGVLYPRLRSDIENPNLYPQILTYPSIPKCEDIKSEGNGHVQNERRSSSNQLQVFSTTAEQCLEEKVAEVSPENDDEGNQSFAKMWSNHWREYISILPGLIILFGNFASPEGYSSMFDLFGSCIIGGILGGALISTFNKKYLYCIASICLFVASCSFTKNVSFVDVSALLYGMSFGLANFTTIIRASDITSRKMRNFALKSITFTFALQTIAASILLGYREYYRSISMFFALISILLSLLPNESALFLLENGQSDEALAVLAHYNSESTPSDKTKKIYEILRTTAEADKLKSSNVFSADNVRPLLLACGARLLSVLFFGISMLVMISTTIDFWFNRFPSLDFDPSNGALKWSAIYLFRLTLGSIYEIFISRYTKTNFMYYGLATFSGILLLIYSMNQVVWDVDVSSGAFVLFILINFLISFSFDLRNNVLVAKIPRNKRAWSLVIAGGLQSVTEPILYILLSPAKEIVPLVTGFCLFGISIMMIKCTNKKTPLQNK